MRSHPSKQENVGERRHPLEVAICVDGYHRLPFSNHARAILIRHRKIGNTTNMNVIRKLRKSTVDVKGVQCRWMISDKRLQIEPVK